MKNAHLKPLLENELSMEVLYLAAQKLAIAAVPDTIAKAVAMSRMTALVKSNGRVRGIATGDTFRRLVAHTLAQQYASAFLEHCEPFQFVLSTRAGMDAIAHLLRAATDLDEDATVVSLDGIGAYDHLLRAEFFAELLGSDALSSQTCKVQSCYLSKPI